jgi:hypothetical protein
VCLFVYQRKDRIVISLKTRTFSVYLLQCKGCQEGAGGGVKNSEASFLLICDCVCVYMRVYSKQSCKIK